MGETLEMTLRVQIGVERSIGLCVEPAPRESLEDIPNNFKTVKISTISYVYDINLTSLENQCIGKK